MKKKKYLHNILYKSILFQNEVSCPIMPFRDPEDEAARIQAICRGWLTRQRLRYPCFYFPPRPATPDSRRYRAPTYRNDDWVYWDRQQYLDRHCGLETESGDCVDQGTKHSLENTSHGEGTEAYCDWCWKGISGSDRCFTCSSCDFDVCIECMEYAVQNGNRCDLWRFVRL